MSASLVGQKSYSTDREVSQNAGRLNPLTSVNRTLRSADGTLSVYLWTVFRGSDVRQAGL